MKTSRGYILLAVLIFLQVLALLALTTLKGLFLSKKIYARQAVVDFARSKAKKILVELASDLQAHLQACERPQLASAALAQRSLAAWKVEACSASAQNYNYYYLIEPLGENPCLFLDENKKTVALTYRLTLFLTGEQEEFRVLLQTLVLLPKKAAAPCSGSSYQALAGKQKTWSF